MKPSARTRRGFVVAAILASALSMGASYSVAQAQETPAKVSAAAGKVPEAIRKTGILRVGTNLPYPPMEYFEEDGKTLTGADIDLIRGVAERLGLKTDFVNMNWDGLIPALNANRFDVIAASVGDFPERQKQADFVDYMVTSVSVVVPNTDTADYRSNADLCGKRLGASKGTDASRLVTELAERCTASGTATPAPSLFPEDNTGLLAVRSKRIDAYAMDSISAAYEASTEKGRTFYRNVLPDFQKEKALYGFVVSKSNGGLTEAIAGALGDMIADGSYAAILQKYHLSNMAVPAATINAGGSKGVLAE